MSFPIQAPPSEPQIRGHFYWALKGTLSLGYNTVSPDRPQTLPMILSVRPARRPPVSSARDGVRVNGSRRDYRRIGSNAELGHYRNPSVRCSESWFEGRMVSSGSEKSARGGNPPRPAGRLGIPGGWARRPGADSGAQGRARAQLRRAASSRRENAGAGRR